MDDAKRRELESLKSQINPEVLKRVAEAMGQSVPDTGGSAPPSSAPPPRRSSGGGLSGLKARMKKSGTQLDSEARAAKEDRQIPISFLIYDTSHFRAKTMAGLVTRMGYEDYRIISEPQEFLKFLLSDVNNPKIDRTVIFVFDDYYSGVMHMLNSEAVIALSEKIPAIKEVPVFVIYEAKRVPEPIESLAPQYVLTLRHSPEFSDKRMKKALGIETEEK